MLETKWPSLLQTVKGVRFRSLKNPNTPNVSVVIWEFPDKENIQKYVKNLTPKTIEFTGVVTQDLEDLSFN